MENIDNLYDVISKLIADLSKDEWEEIKRYIDKNIDIINTRHVLLEEAAKISKNINMKIKWENGLPIKNRTRNC